MVSKVTCFKLWFSHEHCNIHLGEELLNLVAQYGWYFCNSMPPCSRHPAHSYICSTYVCIYLHTPKRVWPHRSTHTEKTALRQTEMVPMALSSPDKQGESPLVETIHRYICIYTSLRHLVCPVAALISHSAHAQVHMYRSWPKPVALPSDLRVF